MISLSKGPFFKELTSSIKEQLSVWIVLHGIDVFSIFPVEDKVNWPGSNKKGSYFEDKEEEEGENGVREIEGIALDNCSGMRIRYIIPAELTKAWEETTDH